MAGSWRGLLGAVGLGCAVAGLAAACDDTEAGDLVDGTFTDVEWAQVQVLGPFPEIPKDPTNKYADDPRAAAFGQRLFFDLSYSGPLTIGDDGTNGSPGAVGETGKVGCTTCHVPDAWWTDDRADANATSLGVAYTARNAPTLVNVAYYKFFGWGGKQDSMWNQAAGSPESKDNTGGNRLAYAHMVFAKYRADYDGIFEVPLDPALDPAAPDAARFPAAGKPKSMPTDPDGPWELMAEADRQIVVRIMSNCGKSIAAYERLLVSRDTRLDRYLSGEFAALDASEKRGLKLFVGKAACSSCHAGPTMTNNDFHVTGVPQAVGDHVPAQDDGRYTDVGKLLVNTFRGDGEFSDDKTVGAEKLAGLMQRASDTGKFRTKGLRGASETGPYMHNGSLPTLADVVHLYNLGGGPEGSFAGDKDEKIVPLNLDVQEEADLVAFLKTLVGEPVPAELRRDTSAP